MHQLHRESFNADKSTALLASLDLRACDCEILPQSACQHQTIRGLIPAGQAASPTRETMGTFGGGKLAKLNSKNMVQLPPTHIYMLTLNSFWRWGRWDVHLPPT